MWDKKKVFSLGAASKFLSLQHEHIGLKPIFHCDAKTFALGTFASPNAKDSTFAIPNAKSTNMLVSLALGDANFLRHLTQNPQRESVEYRLRWVPNANFLHWPCTFHVVCVSFICVRLPTQTQFSVEYGLKRDIPPDMGIATFLLLIQTPILRIVYCDEQNKRPGFLMI